MHVSSYVGLWLSFYINKCSFFYAPLLFTRVNVATVYVAGQMCCFFTIKYFCNFNKKLKYKNCLICR